MFPLSTSFIKKIAIFPILVLVLVAYLQQNTKEPFNQVTFQQNLTGENLLSKSNLDKLYGQLPLAFEVNKGQTDSSIKFISHGFDYNLQLTNSTVALVSNHKNNAILSLEFVGANDKVKVFGKNELATKTNYLLGQDKTQWQKEIPSYAQVNYQELYQGIDLLFYGNKKHLEYDFIIAPKINPDVIKLKFNGLKQAIKINQEGDLVLEMESGTIYQHKPFIYQEIAGNKVPVLGNYKIIENNLVGFSLGEYNENQPLVIDPEISYSSYLGGSLTDQASAIAVDEAGNAYIVGSTSSTNFPTSSPLQRSFGGGPFDVFVAKFNPKATSLIYATYFGGSSIDQGFDIAVDSSGSVYITGLTVSSNFPNQNAIQPKKGGGVFDAFITKLNPAGNNLVYSTYLGGNDDDQAFSLAINSSGAVFVTGSTSSRNFPGIQGTSLSGASDSFITQINSQGNQIIYSRFLGGSDEEEGSGIVVDSSNNAYVIGDTFSNNFPVQMPVQTALSGGQDAFLAKLNPNGAILYSTYFGGSNNDAGIDIAVDKDGNAYLTGTTNSTNLLAKSALQRNLAGATDSFIAKIDATGANLVYSTYLGGKADDTVSAIGLDPLGNVYVTGTTFSTDFPTVKPLQDKNRGMNDIFVSVLDSTGGNFLYSTYLGGNAQDVSLAMTVDKDGTVYLAGSSISTNFPTTDAFQRVSGGNSDAFITKITNDISTPPAPDFSLSITPNLQTISPGMATSFTINSRAINGFNQPISLSAATSPSNNALSTSFSNNTIMPGNSATLTVSTANNVNAATFNITITATSGQLTRTITAVVNIVIPDFSISVEPSTQSVVAGNQATFTVRTKSINGFNKPITLAASASPSDSSLTSSFSSDTISADGNAMLKISTTSSTQLTSFTITIVAIADQLVKTTTVTLEVTSSAPMSDFSLSLNPSQLNVLRKQSGSFNIMIVRTGDFSGNVMVLAPDTKAAKVILTPTTQSTSGNIASFSFKIKRKAPKGSQMLTFIGRDDLGRSRSVTLTLNIQ
ncbi:MAG: SBBP repeat-containing protein [Acidobacteria bacterium]|nr:SBBP repeat-containing protein [Acidobacteriota bacterium]